MKQTVIRVLLAIAIGTVAPALYAADSAATAQDGVKVGSMSALRKLVPEQQVEATAFQQYAEMKQQAGHQGKLVPESHPQVQRLRRIANACAATRETEPFRAAYAAPALPSAAPLDLVPEWFASVCDTGLAPA